MNFPIEFKLGNLNVSLIEGSKQKGDYCIRWGSHQFKDKDLFEYLKSNILSKEKLEEFLEHLTNFQDFWELLEGKTIEDFQIVFDYVNNLQIENDMKRAIFSIIHRCNIDNINYPPPKYNGAIRHITQILILFGLIFDDKKFIPNKIINSKEDPVKLVDDIGFPRNIYDFHGPDFNEIYLTWKEHK